jgi:hypothetical protein
VVGPHKTSAAPDHHGQEVTAEEVAEGISWVPLKIQSALQSDWSSLLVEIQRAVRRSRRGDPTVDLDSLYARSSWEWLDLQDCARRYGRLVRAGVVPYKGRGTISSTYASLLAGFNGGMNALSTAMLLASTSARDADSDKDEDNERKEVVGVVARASDGVPAGEEPGGQWACAHCTFSCNPDAHLACGVCYQQRLSE